MRPAIRYWERPWKLYHTFPLALCIASDDPKRTSLASIVACLMVSSSKRTPKFWPETVVPFGKPKGHHTHHKRMKGTQLRSGFGISSFHFQSFDDSGGEFQTNYLQNKTTLTNEWTPFFFDHISQRTSLFNGQKDLQRCMFSITLPLIMVFQEWSKETKNRQKLACCKIRWGSSEILHIQYRTERKHVELSSALRLKFCAFRHPWLKGTTAYVSKCRATFLADP